MEHYSNFIKTIMEQDLDNKKHDLIITRFPPEPNGFLHIGHARAVIINFELAKHFNGYTNLRYDDTNPSKEDDIYVRSILEDIRFLGYEPKHIFFASDYFEEMFDRALILINKGLAYVDHSPAEQMAKDRGNVNTAGVESPYRNRSIEENLTLFQQMRAGHFEEGSCVLRAKIDMASPNMNMRDPALYRISYTHHHRQKDTWCIYPMYDYAHPLEDAIEGITHSLCSLEFEDHRPLYDWVVYHCDMPNIPRQIEFGRLNIENTVMSKRYLRQLVENQTVNGWDDPRMPTLQGLKRRGFTKEAIIHFILSAGLSKVNSTISNDMLDAALRDDLSGKAKRAMGVIDPLKVTITNYPKDETESLIVPYHQDFPELGTRSITFSKELYIEREDFILEKPNKKYKRLFLGAEVRLFHAYFIKANEVIYNAQGDIVEVLVTYDQKTKSGTGFDERKPNGTIHFVSAKDAHPTSYNFFGPMITGSEDLSLEERFNQNSWETKEGFVEKSLTNLEYLEKVQLMRNGYYSVDPDSTNEHLVLNEIVSLKRSYS